MKRILTRAVLAVALAMAAQNARADDAAKPAAEAPAAVTLHSGDAAPAIAPAKWLKGEPVVKFESGKIYIVEFWATWCGPCRASIPHLTELQKKYPEVTFIGMDCLEQEPGNVPDFIKSMGDKMDYRVAADDAAGTNAKAWLEAAGQDGIPCAFVVGKDSKIAWIGHPMALEDPLKQIIAGNFDVHKAAADAKEQEQLEDKVQKAVENSDIPAIDKLLKDHPDLMENLGPVKFQLLIQKKDYPAAMTFAKELVDSQKDNAEILNDVAWMMVDPENPIEKPDLDLALKAATRATEITKGEEGPILDTLARVYFNRGDVEKAIETQKKAVAKATDEDKEQLTKSLAEFEAKKKAAK